jgi:phosphoglycolate phosphatase
MLVLFDIDMTLISTSGSGMRAMVDAGKELFGPGFHADGVGFAGRLDPLILVELLRLNGVDPSERELGRMRSVYRGHLERRLAVPGVARSLPGVCGLLGALGERSVTLGLLTGNFEETGSLKLRAAGIDPAWFSIRVWGDDSPVQPAARDHLVPVGLARDAAARGSALAAAQVTVIGDTPNDVGCARAHGCRSIGVATGQYTQEDLRKAGADLVLPDLRATGGVLSWIVGEE